jgi:hypothetical protein
MPLSDEETHDMLEEFGALKADLRNLTEIVRGGFQRADQDRARVASDLTFLAKKFDDLAYDMKQLPQLRLDHTELKKRVDEMEPALDTLLALKLDERINHLEGFRAGLRWVWAGITLAVGAIVAGVMLANSTFTAWFKH